MAINVTNPEKHTKPPAEEAEPFAYGTHTFTKAELSAWRLVADDADSYWHLRGSDNVLDEDFRTRFGVTMFEHAALSRQMGRWR